MYVQYIHQVCFLPYKHLILIDTKLIDQLHGLLLQVFITKKNTSLEWNKQDSWSQSCWAEREDTCVSQHKLTSVAVCCLNGNTHMQRNNHHSQSSPWMRSLSHVAAAQHLTPDKPPLCFMFGRRQKENLLEDAANSDESAHLKATDWATSRTRHLNRPCCPAKHTTRSSGRPKLLID